MDLALGEDFYTRSDLAHRCCWPVLGAGLDLRRGLASLLSFWLHLVRRPETVTALNLHSKAEDASGDNTLATGWPAAQEPRQPMVKIATEAVKTKVLRLPPMPTTTPDGPKGDLMIAGDTGKPMSSVPVATSTAALGNRDVLPLAAPAPGGSELCGSLARTPSRL